MILIRKPDWEVDEFVNRLVDTIQSVVGRGSGDDVWFLKTALKEFLEEEGA